MAIYMKLQSAQGDVTAQGYANQIELITANWSMSRTLRSALGSDVNREASSPYVSEMTVTKYVDSASKGVANMAFGGKAEDATIEFTRTDKGGEVTYRKIVLTAAIISGLSNDAGGADRPTETITLNFTKIAITDTQMKEDASGGSPSTVTYDLGLAKTE